MLSQRAVKEFQQKWLPNATDSGLQQLLGLLDQHSPRLIRGDWTNRLPGQQDDDTGCLATHIARSDPAFQHQADLAGQQWLESVAGVDTIDSYVLKEWDGGAQVIAELAFLTREEQRRRCAARGLHETAQPVT